MPISETTQEQHGMRRDMLLNVGPSHPAMHGVIRILAELEGETITKTEI
jgi:NADH-quinone oxidoreductase subunit D